mmetsp:Transcript_53910/g.118068  ORF Transcript_53910/g.118068 Transcript_53910/m.118068 type:complete len:382 (+) Transcript_53910:201-1346(+)
MRLLREKYDAVVVATGAQGEKKLGLAGEELPGVYGAPEFVKWYNGHPDHASLNPVSPGDAAVVIGQGNVALDIARILGRPEHEMKVTDINLTALGRINEWQHQGLRTIHVVGRRGFVQAAFTNKELRELDTYPDVLAVVDPKELELSLNAASKEELAKSRMKKRAVSILEKMAKNFAEKDSTSKRVVWLRFLQSPTAILPNAEGSQVGAVRLERTELSGEAGQQRASKAASGEEEEIQCGLLIRSVGFDLVPMEGVPLDARKRISHSQGRIKEEVDGDKSILGNLYTAGWAKRGPTGIIATNLTDGQETAASILSDIKAVGKASGADVAVVEAALKEKNTRVVSFEAWRKIEAEEHKRGAARGSTAEKMTNVEQMLKVAGV